MAHTYYAYNDIPLDLERVSATRKMRSQAVLGVTRLNVTNLQPYALR
jgi:hypothetical protein